MIKDGIFEITFPILLDDPLGHVVFATDLTYNYFMSGGMRETRCCNCDKKPQ